MLQAGRTTEVLVTCYSRFGVPEQLAQHIMDGVLRVPAAEASLLAVGDEPVEQLRQGEDVLAMALRRATIVNRLTAADALIVGAPAYFGSMPHRSSGCSRIVRQRGTHPPPTARDRNTATISGIRSARPSLPQPHRMVVKRRRGDVVR